MSATYNIAQIEAALAGVEEKATRRGSREGKPAAIRVRLAPEQLSARDYVNQEAISRPDDWVPRFFPGAEKQTGGYRISPEALGRSHCEEALSITTNGIRDFAQQWDDDAAPGYTPTGSLSAFCVGVDGNGDPILTDEFDEIGKPSGSLSDREACRCLARVLGIDWDKLQQEELQRAFAEPPYSADELCKLSKPELLSRLSDLRLLKSGWPHVYEDIRDWHDTVSTIGAAELDALLTKKRALKFLLLGDTATLPDANDFVEDVFCEGQLSVIFGDANVGKTFIVFDLAMRVARGEQWSRKQTDRGLVVFIAGEGAGGMKRRILASLKHHGVEDASKIPFALIPDTVNFREPESIETFVATLQEISAHFGMPVRWIIVDTLSRALAGGNENAPDDMGALVRGADRLRTATGSHVSFIHHTGKDETKGARGHSLLRAAVDTEVEIRRVEGAQGAISVTVTKQRDLEIAQPLVFRLVTVELGTNRRGKPITSCVVEETAIKPVLTETEREAMEILTTLLFDGDAPHVKLAVWREAIMSRDDLLTGQSRDTNKLSLIHI